MTVDYCRKLKLPSIKSAEDENKDKLLSLTLGRPDGRTLELSPSSVAKLDTDTFDKFTDSENVGERYTPTCVCWMAGGDLLVGCQGGQIVKVNRSSSHA